MSSTNRGRAGKFQKAKRGGGRQFTRGLRPVDADGVERSMWAEPKDNNDSDDSDSDEDSDSEESDSDDAGPSGQQQSEMTREERRAAAKAKKEAAIKKKKGVAQPGDLPPNSDSEEESDSGEDQGMPANPNHSASSRKMAEKAVADPTAVRPATKVKKPEDLAQLSRREREALQAQQAKERYQKLHAEGKTEEARADLERLKLVRQQREEAAALKDAEKQERAEIDKEKKAQMERMERQAALKAARGGKGGKKGGKK